MYRVVCSRAWIWGSRAAHIAAAAELSLVFVDHLALFMGSRAAEILLELFLLHLQLADLLE
jgi:hypothetical protein